MRAPPPRVVRSTLLRGVLLAPSVSNSTLDRSRQESKGDLLSIRSRRQDRIAAHQLNTARLVALQVTEQRKPQCARRTRATNTLLQKQLSHRTTTMADKWRAPQRLSIDPDRVRKRTDAPARARRQNPESGLRAAPQNATAATQVPPAQEDARRGTAPPPPRLPELRKFGERLHRRRQTQWTRGQRPDDVGAQDRRRGLGRPASW